MKDSTNQSFSRSRLRDNLGSQKSIEERKKPSRIMKTSETKQSHSHFSHLSEVITTSDKHKRMSIFHDKCADVRNLNRKASIEGKCSKLSFSKKNFI
jgi:hypothetical protein